MNTILPWSWMLILTIHLTACSSETKHLDIHIFKDITSSDIDDFQPQIIHNFITNQVLESTERISPNSAVVNLHVLNEFRHNPIIGNIQLTALNLLEDKAKERKTEQELFSRDLLVKLEHLQQQEMKNLPSSMIVEPIFDQLKQSTDILTERIFIIYSDMLHNQKNISFYKDERDKLEEFLIRQIPPETDFSSTTIYCIYAPNTPKKDRLFEQAKQTWQSVIHKTGGRIYFLSNL